jgi:ANTAR domain
MQSQAAVRHARATWAKVSAEWQQVEARWVRAEQVREVWLSCAPSRGPRQYSAYARMQVRLASVPVIEQAKRIIMAECGFTADEASDALWRASVCSQMRVRELAATIVARTAGT